MVLRRRCLQHHMWSALIGSFAAPHAAWVVWLPSWWWSSLTAAGRWWFNSPTNLFGLMPTAFVAGRQLKFELELVSFEPPSTK